MPGREDDYSRRMAAAIDRFVFAAVLMTKEHDLDHTAS